MISTVSGLERARALVGYSVCFGLSYLFSVDRKHVRWRPVGFAVAMQAAAALIVLNPVIGRFFFDAVDRGVRRLLSFADEGINFLFQSIVAHQVTYTPSPGAAQVTETFVGRMSPALKSVAFSVLPTVIFFSALISVLYHLGLMQRMVHAMAWSMRRLMRTSGAETLCCAANVFVGQTEAPIMVRPFLTTMTRSELMAVMTGGFATVAGGVLAIYVGLLQSIAGIAGHLVTASLMAAPAALGFAKLIVPECQRPLTADALKQGLERPDANLIEAAARGASDGMQLALNIAAMLVAFVGLMALVNAFLGLFHTRVETLIGWLLSPLAYAIGIPWRESGVVGQLLGKKLVLTELLAFIDLRAIVQKGSILSPRSAVISSYALCGFANVASIGVQLGGIGAMAPDRRGDLARLGLRAMFAGMLVSCSSAALVALLS